MRGLWRLVVGLLTIAGMVSLSAVPASSQVSRVDTIAGTGETGFNGDDVDATTAQLAEPMGLAVDAAGNILVADRDNHRIRSISPDGMITTVAGNGTAGSDGDGGQAIDAQLNYPRGVAVGADGTIWIADSNNASVRRVALDGTITTAANADSGLKAPFGITVEANGSVVVTDSTLHSVIRLTDGGIETLAGTGEPGFSGDGGPAVDATLNTPLGIATGPNGSLIVADTRNNRIRQIDADGAITTVAGTGNDGDLGDGAPAVDAELRFPRAIAVDPGGVIYIADTSNSLVRRVGLDGVITTVIGTGDRGFNGDGGPATDIQLDLPRGIAIDVVGRLIVSDTNNARIRETSIDISEAAPPLPEPGPVCERTLTADYQGLDADAGSIARLYMAVFTRQPEAAGFDFWVRSLESESLTLDTAADFFVASPEFDAIYGATSDAEFIDLAYQNVLCRDADEIGSAYWLDRLETDLDRGDVMRFFSDSPEFRDATGSSLESAPTVPA